MLSDVKTSVSVLSGASWALYEVVGGVGEALSRILPKHSQVVCEKVSRMGYLGLGAFALPKLVGDISSLERLVSEPPKKKTDLWWKVPGSIADIGVDILGVQNFFSPMKAPGWKIGWEGASLLASATEIFDSAVELSRLDQGNAEDQELVKQKNGWILVKNGASIMGSVISIGGIVSGIVCSSWITLGISIVLFFASLAAFFLKEQIENRQKQRDEVALSKWQEQLVAGKWR